MTQLHILCTIFQLRLAEKKTAVVYHFVFCIKEYEKLTGCHLRHKSMDHRKKRKINGRRNKKKPDEHKKHEKHSQRSLKTIIKN